MSEIKSVRVRSSIPTENDSYGSGDFKVTILEDGLFNKKRTIKSDFATVDYDTTNRYSGLSDDELILDYLSMISKVNKSSYEIIQDPWLESVPKIRKFGFYPYYLNNHSSIYIEWNTNGTTIGGSKYSDKDGLELSYSELQSKNIESPKNKTFFIVGDDKKMFTIGKNNDFISGSDSKVFDGVSTKDSDIIDLIISKWNSTIPDYKVALCDDNGNESCTIIEYKSPINTLEPVKEDVSPNTENILNPQKLKINIQGLVDGLTIKAKQDIPSFKVIIGDLPIGKNISYDEYDNLDELDNEYIEGDFKGDEELEWKPDPLAKEDIFDSTSGSYSSPDEYQPPSGPVTGTQKDFIKHAVKSSGANKSIKGKCARYTFNQANNYIRQIQGRQPNPSSKSVAAGGNANQESYHKNLQNIGYKRNSTINLSKSELKGRLNSSSWEIGDVVAYWSTDNDHFHTQIYTGGYHNGSNYRWSTDNIDNFMCSFVYGSAKQDSWKLIIFKAPKEKQTTTV